jgi:hypothetical protein
LHGDVEAERVVARHPGSVDEGYIAVDEQGTEAAGATAVVIGTDSEPTDGFDMRVNRPFLWLIRDRETGAEDSGVTASGAGSFLPEKTALAVRIAQIIELAWQAS